MDEDSQPEPQDLPHPGLEWSSQFKVVHDTQALPGDKITLPQEALEQLLAAAPTATENVPIDSSSTFDPFNPYTFAAERNARSRTATAHPQLPQPLTFRLVNPDNGRLVYAGIQEFSAQPGQMALSSFLQHALDIKPDGKVGARVTVHAKQLPKGHFVKLRPLEAGYDPEDWKALLEDHMRKNYTTLTQGELLNVPNGRENFRFLVDSFKPQSDGICVVDTDLEVDIEALNEEQARETLSKIAAKRTHIPGTGSSPGGILELLRSQTGQVLPGEYVDFEIPSWARAAGLEIELWPSEPGELCIFASPFCPRQRVRPRLDEHYCSAFEYPPGKRLKLVPKQEDLEDAEAVWVSVHVPAAANRDHRVPSAFSIKAGPHPEDSEPDTNGSNLNVDDIRCQNCLQLVPRQSLMLHENFCLRNNVVCPQGCGLVFKKKSEAFANHSHCPFEETCNVKDVYFDSKEAFERHVAIFHTVVTCPSCDLELFNTILLAAHRISTCPGKLILCRFCHLQVPQEARKGVEAEVLLTGLTPHELADGARTTECHLCGRITRLRDMDAHLRHHDLERKDRPAPRVCRNLNCGRTIDGTNRKGETRGQARDSGNNIGLCSSCFGPLYVSMHDPDGKALKRRVERKYLGQLLSGCGKAWCRNELCKTGRANESQSSPASIPTKDALPMIKPYVDGLLNDTETPLHFCVDEKSQQGRRLAELLAAEGGKMLGEKKYELGWCVGALEAEGGDVSRAREWLRNFAMESGRY